MFRATSSKGCTEFYSMNNGIACHKQNNRQQNGRAGGMPLRIA